MPLPIASNSQAETDKIGAGTDKTGAGTDNTGTGTNNTGAGKITAAELRLALQSLTERLDQIEASLAAVREGLSAAASQPISSQPAGEIIIVDASVLLMSYDDNGQPIYKVKGGQYMKFGIRVWPEVLPVLGIQTTSLKPGPNPINLRVRVLMGEHGPRKVVSLA
jgi:hypothetical protein